MNSSINTLWWAHVEDDLHARVLNLGLGGSGYTVRSSISNDQTTMATRWREIDPRSKIVVFFGSRNDGAVNPAKLASAAKEGFAGAKRIAPKATLVVIGPPWTSSTAPEALRVDRNVLRMQARQAGAVWVDPIAANWFPTGNKFIGSDGVHPNDGGHEHLAALIEPILKRYL